jgi:membrane protein implicated in regulation of membrane protease activity
VGRRLAGAGPPLDSRLRFRHASARPRRSVAILSIVYLALAVLGAGYIAIATLLGHLSVDTGPGGVEHAGDASVDYGVGGHDGHGSASAGSHDAPSFHFPFFSPLALAALFGCLGGYGLIALYGFNVGEGASLAFALPAALATSYAITYGAWRLVRSSTGSSEIRMSELRGARGEVLTPIPAGGVGEVAVLVGHQRFNAPAREFQGREVARGQVITVREVAGATLIVGVGTDQGEAR